MVRPEVARQKVANALARLEQAETLVRGSGEGVPADQQASDLASFYLLLAIQEAIDLAAHWISDAGWIPPADAGGTFQLLAERGAIDPDLARGLRAAQPDRTQRPQPRSLPSPGRIRARNGDPPALPGRGFRGGRDLGPQGHRRIGLPTTLISLTLSAAELARLARH
jgi:hypothetical protein